MANPIKTVSGDMKTLWHLAVRRAGGDTHAERLENFYSGQASNYDDFRRRMLHSRELIYAVEKAAPDFYQISTRAIRIDDGGAVATTTLPGGLSGPSAGDAGQIELNAANLFVGTEGQIDSSSLTAGAAGSISLTASESIAITGPGSRVASRAGAQGDGGSLSLIVLYSSDCVGGGMNSSILPFTSHSDISPVAGSPRGAVSHSTLVPWGQAS